jgi:beta-glucosidase
MTFPYSTGQIPVYYNHRQSARPHQGKYQDIPSTPLYDFAYGLSYTTFAYGDLKASSAKIRKGEKLSIEIPVSNTGKMDGQETVHWFISDPVSTISRPVKELKYFEKQMIKTGETKVFRFAVDPERDFGFVDGNGKRFLESGDYYILVGDKKIKIEVVD